MLAALAPHAARWQQAAAVAPAAGAPAPLPPADIVAALLGSVARDLFEAIPPVAAAAAADGAASVAGGGGGSEARAGEAAEAAPLAPPVQQALSAAMAAALQHAADLLRMSMLTAGLLPARVGGARVPAAAGYSAPLFAPIRQLAVASALALGTLPDTALAHFELQALASLLVGYTVAADAWPLLSGGAVAGGGGDGVHAPELAILAAAAARMRRKLAARGMPHAAQVAALQRLPLVCVTPRLVERALPPPPHVAAPAPMPAQGAAAGGGSAAELAMRKLRPASTVMGGLQTWGFHHA